MNQANVTAFITALRSGDYAQGQSCLRSTSNQFCCLGVATDLAVKAGVQPEGMVQVGSTVFTYESLSPITNIDNPSSGYLPNKVMDWLGANTNSPQLIYHGNERHLTELNDQEQLSFAELADLLQDQWLPNTEPVTAVSGHYA